MASGSGNLGFFDPQLNSYRPGLEPPGFDILRELLIRQIIGMKQNPYGMSPAGEQNIHGPLFSSGLRQQPSLGYMNQGGGNSGGNGGSAGHHGQMSPHGGRPPGGPRLLGPPIAERPSTGGRGRYDGYEDQYATQGRSAQQPRQGWFWDLLNQVGNRGSQGGMGGGMSPMPPQRMGGSFGRGPMPPQPMGGSFDRGPVPPQRMGGGPRLLGPPIRVGGMQ